jgi:cytosine/adenosine deaminase-related metal-dependent hydrolase
MATMDGAAVLGLGGVVGELTPGAAADLVALRPRRLSRGADPCARALDIGTEVERVLVAGRTLLDESGPSSVDAERVRDAAARVRATLC